MPMLVFRVIDTGRGLGTGGTGEHQLFSAFVTGASKASHAGIHAGGSSNSSKDKPHAESLESPDLSGNLSTDSDAPAEEKKARGETSASSAGAFKPTAADGSASSVAKQKGSGLGLAMAEELTKQMGGTITLRTERRRGRTVLEVALPVRPPWRVVKRMDAAQAAGLARSAKALSGTKLAQEMTAIDRARRLLVAGNPSEALSACSARTLSSESVGADMLLNLPAPDNSDPEVMQGSNQELRIQGTSQNDIAMQTPRGLPRNIVNGHASPSNESLGNTNGSRPQ